MFKESSADGQKIKMDPIKDPKDKSSDAEFASITLRRTKSVNNLLKEHLKDNVLIIMLFVAVAAGVSIGMALRSRSEHFTDDELFVIKFPGELLLGMLKLIVIPLIVSSLISGITTLDPKVFKKIGTRTLVYFAVTSYMAVCLGILLVRIIHPGTLDSTTMDTETDHDEKADVPTWATFANLIKNLFPDNIVEVTFRMKLPKVVNGTDGLPKVVLRTKDSRPNMLGIVVICVVLGIAINKLGTAADALRNFMIALNEVSIRIVVWVIWFSPFGVMCLIVYEVVRIDNPGKLFSDVGFYCLTVMLGLVIHGFVTLPLIYLLIVHTNPFEFLRGMSTSVITALATASSLATLPMTMRDLEVHNQIDRRIIDFVAPVGANLNMDGTALFEAVGSIFIAEKLGRSLSYEQIFIVSLTAMAASVGAAGVPHAGLVTMGIVLASINVPISGVAYIVAVDWFLDRFRTMVNILGDAYGAGIIYHLSVDDLDSLEDDEPLAMPKQVGSILYSNLHMESKLKVPTAKIRGMASAPPSSYRENKMVSLHNSKFTDTHIDLNHLQTPGNSL